MGDFIFDYFMGSIFKSMVVVFSALNVDEPIKNTLYLVAQLGL